MTLRSRSATLLTTAIVASTLVFAAPAEAAATYDGTTQERAAASCWEIKQNDPDAPSGRYWIVTPRLQVPTQFYCDQTTNGGGWVLVGRGRHGWVEGGDGQGTTADVSAATSGAAMMKAKQLSGTVIDGLLNSGRVDALPDGIRLRRATDTSGSRWQEARVKISQRDRWTWALAAGLPVSSYSVDGTSVTTAQKTDDLRISTDTQRAWTRSSATNGYIRGFNYGKSGPNGTTAADSFLYSTVAGGDYATPFTQMYLRPKLLTTQMSYPTIPLSGTPSQAGLAIPESGALPSPWGVTGLGAGGSSYYSTEVSAFAQIGSRVYVGGNFTTVRNSAGTISHTQSYLASFDARTGEWISSFRPTFDHQVKALAVLPNGKLAVGGQFGKVNGKVATALVVLDPTSGATDPSFTATLTQTTTGANRWVRSLDVSGNHLYVGGGFTRYSGGTDRTTRAFRNIVRVSTTTGTPDTTWRPNLGTGILQSDGKRSLSSSVLSLDVSDDGAMVYAAGQFTQGYVGDDGKTAVSKPGLAAIKTSAPATFQSWPIVYSSTVARTRYQQAVKQVGSRVWTGGSQHNLFAYLASSLKLSISNITVRGGDFQAIAARSGIVYASCHCFDWNYSGTTRYDAPKAAGYTQVDRIGGVGAWNASTGDYIPSFSPTFDTRTGEGPWALMTAADGTLWSGGDYTSVVGRDGKNQWTGGFARFAVRPHTPPAAPSALKATLSGSTAHLSWTMSSTSGATHEVLRNNRVVATTPADASSVSVPGSAAGDRWYVRATDGNGNRSSSTPAVSSTVAPAESVSLSPAGAQWAYWFDRDQPVDTRWKGPTWEPGNAWLYGAAPLGWGPNAETSIDTPTTAERALTAYFRRRFTADPADFSTITITTRSDDGAVVYLNGTEIGRKNLPAGTITPTTYAGDETADRAWTITVPASMLRAGDRANTLAVEVHLNSRGAAGVSHEAVISGTP
ncbi:fibrinogen-like YCDxxxxGGGW domain-containing protein [Aeromicrobium sp.]|uniref:fibrinogen-like YCDxxxxGGGW domain-containing protein n=1 Tax=Aeromicrobium sp. TaxID=1871063 RepID=UPI0030C1D756